MLTLKPILEEEKLIKSAHPPPIIPSEDCSIDAGVDIDESVTVGGITVQTSKKCIFPNSQELHESCSIKTASPPCKHSLVLPNQNRPITLPTLSSPQTLENKKEVFLAGAAEEGNITTKNNENEEMKSITKCEEEEKKVKMGKAKKAYQRDIIINTCFDPLTPVESKQPQAQPVKAKAASTRSHIRTQHASQPSSATQSTNNPSSTASMATPNSSSSTKKSAGHPRHFIFSEHLFNPQLPFSPNRSILFLGFLREKLGEAKLSQVTTLLSSQADPISLLTTDSEKIITIIGKENAQYLPVFKYILASNGGGANSTTPLSSQLQFQIMQQHHSRTRSMLTPEAMPGRNRGTTIGLGGQNYGIAKKEGLPYSTRACIQGGKPTPIGIKNRKAYFSPCSAVTDSSDGMTPRGDMEGKGAGNPKDKGDAP